MTLEQAFAEQADHCIALGSPFMGRLMTILKNDWPTDSALGRKVAGFEGDVGPMGASLPLRIAAGLHALVLQHKAPSLAAAYPPHEVSETMLSEAVLDALQT
ncbi:DUF2332 family protein, partial [Sulfitobacter sp.]|uniref:DUF2332 family protein n=1 Tax=Sulfitobacter sp. TaxID=1903071 RepID=UPI00405A1B47